MTTGKVLLVEDDDLLGPALSTALKIRNIPNVLAVNGADAIRLLRSDTIGAVVSDLSLPDTNGMDLYAAILHERPDLSNRYIVMSGGSADTKAWRWFLSMPVKLFKPFQNRELVAAVQALP
jgi:DNA-binding response OmpR family regulator